MSQAERLTCSEVVGGRNLPALELQDALPRLHDPSSPTAVTQAME
jgi:hypothetical protein